MAFNAKTYAPNPKAMSFGMYLFKTNIGPSSFERFLTAAEVKALKAKAKKLAVAQPELSVDDAYQVLILDVAIERNLGGIYKFAML